VSTLGTLRSRTQVEALRGSALRREVALRLPPKVAGVGYVCWKSSRWSAGDDLDTVARMSVEAWLIGRYE
jgi:hypothetical protein